MRTRTWPIPPNIGRGGMDPIEDARPVGTLFRKIRPEEDVHRPADAICIRTQPQMLRTTNELPPSAPKRKLRPNGEILARRRSLAGRGHAVASCMWLV